MKYFTKAQIEELAKQLAVLGVKDTDFDEAHELTGDELVAIVQDGVNRKVGVRKLIHDYLPDDIASGEDGDSAYDVWRKNGHPDGTLTEFFEYIRGPRGYQGVAGPAGPAGPTGPRGPQGEGSVVSWNQISSTGTKIAEITINGTKTDVKAPGGGVSEIPVASADVLGGIKLGYQENGRNFAVKITDTGNRAYVTVPGGGDGTGQNGGYYEQIFTAVAHGSAAPSLPSNGASIDDEGVWKHFIDDEAASALGDYDVWMGNRWVSGTGIPGNWLGPWNISGAEGIAGADGIDIEFIYTTTQDETHVPAKPAYTDTQATASISAQTASTEPPSGETSSQKADWYPAGWTDNPVGVSSTMRVEWMSFRTKTGGSGGTGGTWSNFSTPVVWSAYGRQGIDGDGVEYIFAVSATAPTNTNDPSTWAIRNESTHEWTADTNFQNREYIRTESAGLWKDNPVDLSSAEQGTIQWVSMRKKYADPSPGYAPYYTEPYWHPYCTPRYWNGKPRDGVASDVVVNLEPDMFYVPCDSSTGVISNDFSGTTAVTMRYAGASVAGATIGSPVVKDTKATPKTYTSSDGVTVTVSGMNVTVAIDDSSEIDFSKLQLLVTIPVTGTVNSNSVTVNAVLTIVGHSLGTNGTSYFLKTGAGIVRKRDGNFSPSSVAVSMVVNDGTNDFTEYLPVASGSLSALPSGFSIKYFYGTDTEHIVDMATQGINSIPVSGTVDSITVRLLYNSLVILQEYIPVVEEHPAPDAQGIMTSMVFKRSADQPATPNNGTTKTGSDAADINGCTNANYGGEYPNNATGKKPIPYGWSDGIPAYNAAASVEANTIWMSKRIFTSDGQSPQEATWSTPSQASDSLFYDFEFSPSETRPDSPTSNNRHLPAYPYGHAEQVWFDPDNDMYDQGPAYEGDTTPYHLRDFTVMNWMAIRPKNNQYNGPWTIFRIKGEAGNPGVDGKDALHIRIRNWSDLYGQTLTGDNRIFSGFEENAPFRDVIVVTPDDYHIGASESDWLDCPFEENGVDTLALLLVNYAGDSSAYSSGYTKVGYPGASPDPGLILPNGKTSGKNWTDEISNSKTDSADARNSYGYQWAVFTNIGAAYAKILVATQGYIGKLTVDDLLAEQITVSGSATVSETFTANDIRVAGGKIGALTVTQNGINTHTETGPSNRLINGIYHTSVVSEADVVVGAGGFSVDVTAGVSGDEACYADGNVEIGYLENPGILSVSSSCSSVTSCAALYAKGEDGALALLTSGPSQFSGDVRVNGILKTTCGIVQPVNLPGSSTLSLSESNSTVILTETDPELTLSSGVVGREYTLINRALRPGCDIRLVGNPAQVISVNGSSRTITERASGSTITLDFTYAKVIFDGTYWNIIKLI